MINYSNIPIKINGTQVIADSVSISENSTKSPAYALGYKSPFDNLPLSINNSIDMEYFMDAGLDDNYNSIQTWINNGTGNINCLLNIGGVEMSGYLNRYSFDINQFQPIKSKVSYVVYQEITGQISEQSYVNMATGNSKNGTGIAHYWSVGFYTGDSTFQVSSTGKLINLNYSFDANLFPSYGLSSIYPQQIDIITASETVTVTHESQINTSFSGQNFEKFYQDIHGIRLNAMSKTLEGIDNSCSILPLTGFILENTKFDIRTQNLLLFNNIFKKNY